MKPLRVLQFNMQFGQGWDDADPDHAPIRLEDTITVIREQDADIVFLQEVEHAQNGGVQITPPPNYTRLLAELSGYHGCFTYPRADPRELPFGIGLAILTRTPLRGVTVRDLPSPPVTFDFYGRKTTPTDRVMLRADTTIGGRELRLLNTHLLAFFMLGASSADHPGQRQRVAEELAAAPGPMLLAGDFNVSHHESLVAQFAAQGFRTVQDQEITWRRRPYVLDHIFFNAPLARVAHRVIPTPASDHHALVAEFEWVK
ncbi:endonuclease/exonuclease/phosphatase family protein [Opitutus sp. ER46]|uniref:endonuclease/exonuclease/phosphatase family protein n=1 Tax=Opitutus sp. ER46 TaxID=2161864 RepID=UPI000D30E552|nr:endonuclease/exonuclease/phosphatase family protein [Opitutus sp. ER46]PTX91764.1 endonuclease [Opitutus sp. ER46]